MKEKVYGCPACGQARTAYELITLMKSSMIDVASYQWCACERPGIIQNFFKKYFMKEAV